MRSEVWFAFLAGMLMISCTRAPEPQPPGGVAEDTGAFSQEVTAVAAATLTGEAIRETIAEISADRYEGRGPGSDGDRRTRAYLAQSLDEAGFGPGGPGGSWDQPFELVGIEAAQPTSWFFSGADESLELKQGIDFVVASGVQREQAALADAELVFVGYGIRAPEYQWDDYKDVDLRGSVLVMLNNDPDWDPALFEGETRLYYGRWTYKYESAARQGAVGAIIIHTTPSAGYPWQVVQTSWSGEQFELPAGEEPRVQVAGWVTEAAALRLVDLAGLDLASLVESARGPDFVPVSLGLMTSLVLENTLTRVRSANVLGLLQGSDPELADEVVVYTAHHDHLGLDPNAAPGEDGIYNGARDNASGVGIVSAIARAFGSLPRRPRRSILIAFVGAEEQGLLGSEYFASHPTVAPGKIAAAVNYDSANIWGATRDITFVGLGKSSLDAVALTVARHQGRVIKPDQFPDRGYYYRSDQFSLAQIGVPALYLGSGTEFLGRPPGWGEQQINAYTDQHYHQPTDQLDDEWSFAGMEQDARFGFWSGLIIANSDEFPAWTPGDEFEAARLEALAAIH